MLCRVVANCGAHWDALTHLDGNSTASSLLVPTGVIGSYLYHLADNRPISFKSCFF